MTGPEPGLEILPGLTLVRRLGRGGMGEAWLARDAEQGQEVVAKLLPADAPRERLALLWREARLVRKLRHPRIVPVYGFRSGERFCALTQRHMSGGDASSRRGAAPAEIARLGRDVADALAYLHEVGVVHRDVKLSNVLLDGAGHAHLADFGICAVAEGDEDGGIVVRGGGSRASMSPQQRAGAPAQPADDLYALGVLLFELLCGHAPGEGDPAAAAARALQPPQVPARLAGLVASLLAATPEARPRSAETVRDELAAIADEATAEGPARPGRGVRLQPPPRAPEPDLVPTPLEPRTEAAPARAGLALARPQVALLGALLLLVIAAVFWVPRWAEVPGAPGTAPASVPPAPSVAVSAPAPPPVVAKAAGAPGAQPEAPAEKPSQRVQPSRTAPAVAPQPGVPPAAAAASPEATPSPAPTPDLEAEARALAGYRDQGAAFEAREQWREARQQYEAALAIDSHLTFALEGRERAMRRAALDDALDFHLQRPDRLSAAAVGREADALLERARGTQPSGPALEARVAALETALARARTPVAVVIESDGLTELTLSRVGKLGTLKRRSLELLPGSYTVTGSRPGYRDVRRQFKVAPGAPGPSVSLRCEETL